MCVERERVCVCVCVCVVLVHVDGCYPVRECMFITG